MLTVIPFLSGLVLHQIYRIKEPEITPSSLSLIILFPLFSSSIQFYITRVCTLTSFLLSYIICYITWAASVITYRLSPFHPLSSFPGPWHLRISKLINAWIYSKGRQHEIFRQLHKQYGEIVRVGPNELSICEVSAVKSVLGSEGLPKGNCKIFFFLFFF
jgi:hypothetical protein